MARETRKLWFLLSKLTSLNNYWIRYAFIVFLSIPFKLIVFQSKISLERFLYEATCFRVSVSDLKFHSDFDGSTSPC